MRITKKLKQCLKCRSFKALILVSFVMVNLSACSDLASVGTRAMFAGEGAKGEMLGEKVKTFSRARYWRDHGALLAMMEPKLRREKASVLSTNDKQERLVEIQPGSTLLAEDGESATVTVNVKYFKVPVYQVEEREEELRWVFHRLDGGWYLDSWTKGEIVKNES